MSRKKISTRTRFEIFKRDGFRCAYCGASPVSSLLHVDHVVAVVNGGSDDADNLITSCQSCNLGKSGVPIEQNRFSVGDKKRAREHAKQIQSYLEAQKEVADLKKQATEQLINQWCEALGTDTYHKNLTAILPKAVEEFGIASVLDFILVVSSNRWQWENKPHAFEIDLKYFCGVLRKRREGW